MAPRTPGKSLQRKPRGIPTPRLAHVGGDPLSQQEHPNIKDHTTKGSGIVSDYVIQLYIRVSVVLS
jgi:hypothetical protein